MTPVAIRGMAVHSALGPDRAVSVNRLATNQCPEPGHLSLPETLVAHPLRFCSLADGGDPLSAGRMDRFMPPVIETALADAGLDADARRRLPVFLGSSCFNVRDSELAYARELATGAAAPMPMPLVEMSDIAQRVARVAGSKGPDFSFNTACSSAANALLTATRHIRAGLSRRALVVGVELANLTSLTGFSSLQLLSDHIAPFGADRDGIVLGEGIGAVILEAGEGRLQLLDGMSRVDTHAVATANPDGRSLATVTRAALEASQLEAADIRAIKAHATSTPSNDTAEANALHQVFADLPPVSTLKPWIGHTLGACGIVELILFAAALEHGFLPAAPRLEPDPELAVEPVSTPVAAHPGAYLFNQFGFGGNNNVLALELTC